MEKIDGNEIVNLMFLSMTDDKVIEMIDRLGMEQPVLDEKYEIEEVVTAGLNDDTGMFFTFREIDGLSKDGMPNLTIISFDTDKNVIFPYKLEYGDSYKACCDKLGKKADYLSDLMDENRIWRTKLKDIECGITLVFTDETLEKLDGLIIYKFREDHVGDSLIPNEE
jgi:hypothetical protein